MIVAIVFATVWGVTQLILLGSLARTIRVRTVLAALTAGLYVVAPLTALLQVALTRPAAWMTGRPVAEMAAIASYTINPFIEELMKVAPLAVLLLVRVIRRQWSLTDCVLMAAATGAGFGLAEELYRYGSSAAGATAIAGGWTMSTAAGTALLVPGIWTALTSWLPVGVSPLAEGVQLNAHVVWSAMGGLAVGLIVLNKQKAARIAGIVLLLYIALDHAADNGAIMGDKWPALLATPHHWLASLRGVMAIAALATAWWLDRARQSTGDAHDLMLAAERSASPRLMATLRAAFSRLPWSVLRVDSYVRTRRAYATARAVAPTEPDGRLHAVVVGERDRVDRELAQSEAPRWLPAGWNLNALRQAVRRPAVIVWLVLLAPSFLWFVVGGWPPLARIQALMMGPVLGKLTMALSVAMQAWIGWSVIRGIRGLPKSRRLPFGDDAAVMVLRTACGVGAIGLGGFALIRIFAGLPPGASILQNLNVADAANRMPGEGGMILGDSAGGFAPPDSDDTDGWGLPDDAGDADPAAAAAAAGAAAGATVAGGFGGDGSLADVGPQDVDALAQAGAAQAENEALQAEADAREADQQRQVARRAADAADIETRTADPNSDPGVAAARERAQQARDASYAADAAAAVDDIEDPWSPNSKVADADVARAASKAADAEAKAAEDDFWERKRADAAATEEVAKHAAADADAAHARAAETRDTATTVKDATADLMDKRAAQAAREADPKGAAADDAAADYAAAQKRADDAFYKSDGDDPGAYRKALDAAAQAKTKAEAAQAAADAAREARAGQVTRADTVGKPDKPWP